MSQQQQDTWELIYWQEFPGRAEFSRLLFVETETPFKEVCENTPNSQIPQITQEYKKTHLFKALPLLKHNDLLISQSSLQVKYVAQRVGNGRLFPKNEINQIRAEEIFLGIADLVEEGCRAWHAIDYNKSYTEQKEETQPFIEYYINKRLPLFLDFFESILQKNDSVYLVGNELSYVDLAMWFVLDGNEFEKPEIFQQWRDQQKYPYLEKLRKNIESLPRISKWKETRPQRNQIFTKTGPIF